MENYIVFAGFTYYAAAGWQNFCGRFAILDEAIKHGEKEERETYSEVGWWQVVDLRTDEIVAGEGASHVGLYGSFPAMPDKA